LIGSRTSYGTDEDIIFVFATGSADEPESGSSAT
jgi:hypothetical protein